MEGAGVRRFKPYNVVHLGQLGVVPGQLHGGRVDIAAPDLIVPVELPVLGLIGGIHPGLSGEPAPLLGGEGAVQARSPVFGDEGGLDGDGARTAEGVAQRVPAPVAGEEHHGGGQGLPQGGVHPVGPVAPLVKAWSRGVQHQDGGVFHDGELDLEERSGLREGIQAVGIPQTGGGRLFHNGLAGRHGMEGGIKAVPLDREPALPGDELLPGEGTGPLKQGVEISGREGAQHQQHPLPGAQI